jgi:peptidoglycan/xylan/chitin deacetylase (PgdA/CDA1 family)
VVVSAQSHLVSVVIALVVGIAVGAGTGVPRRFTRRTPVLMGAGLLTASLVWVWLPRAVAIGVAVAVAAGLAMWPQVARHTAPTCAIAIAAVTLFVVTTIAIGATSPRSTWLGRGVTHGPRSVAKVALTFDDGPNIDSTLAVADVLDHYGVKASFFVVGSALDAAPDIEKSLLDDGQLLGSHAYHHNTWRWVLPDYDELDQSLHAMQDHLGLCPTFFRPPHGFHTPFMSANVSDHHMEMVMWDVSAADWATDDAALVAKRVLAKARPGSIILLHDGLDGHLHVDRSVVVRALPTIIEGLRARGLEPVRLDELLGKPAYAGDC